MIIVYTHTKKKKKNDIGMTSNSNASRCDIFVSYEGS